VDILSAATPIAIEGTIVVVEGAIHRKFPLRRNWTRMMNSFEHLEALCTRGI